MTTSSKESEPIKPQLGLWDAVSIIIGIVIGATIYESPQLIFSNVPGPWTGLGAWALAGLLSLIGALCYAELATTYPRLGGDYVFLTRAYGSWAGFFFGWGQLAVIFTASIAAMAFVFGRHAVQLWNPKENWPVSQHLGDFANHWDVIFALAAVTVLSLMNILGVVLGKWTQNVLTLAKIVGLGGIVLTGISCGDMGNLTVARSPDKMSFGLAMVIILYAYGGWNDAAFVAAEVRDRRDITRSLIIGIAGIMVIYLAVNGAYLAVLGFDEVRDFTKSVPALVLGKLLGDNPEAGYLPGYKTMCVLVMISALGAINGLIYTGSRVYAVLGRDHSVFALLGRWNRHLGTPVWSLLIQGVITVVMIMAVGTKAGRNAIDEGLIMIGLKGLPWEEYHGGFMTLVSGTAPVFWVFFLMTGISLFILRRKDRHIPRFFQVPLFPVVPIIFCLTCLYMLYSAVTYAKLLSLIGVLPLLIGLPLYWLSKHHPPAADHAKDARPG